VAANTTGDPERPDETRVFSERSLPGQGRRVVRLGAPLSSNDLSTLPPRYRPGVGGPLGVSAGARLRARTGEIWLRLRGQRPWARKIRTIPLSTTQPPTPTPDALELRRHMAVDCRGGHVGRLEGLIVDTRTGVATELLVRVRDDVEADVSGPTSALAPLLRVRGQQLLLPPVWATKIARITSPLPFLGPSARLQLDASAAQVAHSLTLRADAALLADVWAILAANPAIEPSLPRIRVVVRDGAVTLLGRVPTVRHRLSAEQDVWHIPGVLTVHNELVAAG
jgi:BON domain